MNKCGWCEFSRLNQQGQLICPYFRCQLTQKEILKILEKIGSKK